ncbi:hypothetical protein GW17_00020510, partial [Ensete ventricosum]
FISFSPTPRSLISATRVRLGSTHRLFGAKPKPTLASSHIVSSSRVSVLLISHSPSSSPSETLEEEEDVGRLLSGKRNPFFIRHLPFDFGSNGSPMLTSGHLSGAGYPLLQQAGEAAQDSKVRSRARSPREPLSTECTILMQEVDGKQIQIQLTGFLEKNTGKFMKELWGHLLSAQNNASGVPQQFLDAKEEELKNRRVPLNFSTSVVLLPYFC